LYCVKGIIIDDGYVRSKAFYLRYFIERIWVIPPVSDYKQKAISPYCVTGTSDFTVVRACCYDHSGVSGYVGNRGAVPVSETQAKTEQ